MRRRRALLGIAAIVASLHAPALIAAPVAKRTPRANLTARTVVDGDSISVSVGDATPWPILMAQSLGRIVNNVSVAGTTIHDRRLALRKDVVPLLSTADFKRNIVICFVGTNDIFNGFGNQVQTRIRDYVSAKGRNPGLKTIFPSAKVIFVTMIVRDDNDAAKEEIRNATNTWLRKNYASIGIDRLADADALAQFKTWSNDFFMDKAHLNQAGHRMVRDVIRTHVQALLVA